jgi:hypothetical protein
VARECEYVPAVARVPALATDKVASVSPVDGILAAGTHGVLDLAATVGPPGVEVAIVVTLAVLGDLAGLKDLSRVGIVAVVEIIEGEAQRPNDGRCGDEKRLERDHDEAGNQEGFNVLFLASLWFDCLVALLDAAIMSNGRIMSVTYIVL